MSAITTLAPVLANATAVARPMPLEPPVITTTLSSKEDTFITSSSCLELFLGSALDGVEPRILHLRHAHCGFQDPPPRTSCLTARSGAPPHTLLGFGCNKLSNSPCLGTEANGTRVGLEAREI